MFSKMERELLNGEPWLFEQQSQLTLELPLLDEQEQGRRDIWELPKEVYHHSERVPIENITNNLTLRKVLLMINLMALIKIKF